MMRWTREPKQEFDCAGCGRPVVRVTDEADRKCAYCLTLGVERSRLFQDWREGKITFGVFHSRFGKGRRMARQRKEAR